MTEQPGGRKIIEVRQNVIGPAPPRARQVHLRKASDYPDVPAAYLDLAQRYSSPLMMGPPLCDELIALLRHVFTEEEAGAVRHLGMVLGKTAAQVARAEHRPEDQVAPLLRRLAEDVRSIVSTGPEHKRRYHLLPIVPGMFEMVLIRYTPETLTDWHRRFVELFEALFETGYSLDYADYSAPVVRYLPVGRALAAHPMALPSDHLEAILDRFDVFGVGQCQCRTAAGAKGEGCGRPLGNCAVMGQWAQRGIRDGWLRQVSKQEMIEIKREAESLGMVNWMMNVESTKGQNSCSCCGCCCHAMRMVNEFNAPALFAPPHFLPRIDLERCVHCGRCAQNCPMGALAVDTENLFQNRAEPMERGPREQGSETGSPAKTVQHRTERCIGCGLCLLACQRQRAITMQPVADYRRPYKNWLSLLAHAAPGVIRNSWRVWRGRKGYEPIPEP